MATKNTSLYEKQTGLAAGKVNPNALGGRVRLIHGEFAGASGAAAGDVHNLCVVPAGARVLPISQLHFQAGQGATMTVKVGDKDDDDRYYAATAPGANATSVTLAANALGDKVYSEETTIILTVGTAALTANKKIVFDIYYVTD
jgi:hypothetical protein